MNFHPYNAPPGALSQRRWSRALLGSVALLSVALALPKLRADETRPTETPAPVAETASPMAATVAAEVSATEAPRAEAGAELKVTVEAAVEAEAPASAPERPERTRRKGRQSERVAIFRDHVLGADEVTDTFVTVFGNSQMLGQVNDESVTVFGTGFINGTVKGEVVTVFGDLVIGPKAILEKEAVAVFGRVIREPGAQTKGEVREVMSNLHGLGPGVAGWLRECLTWGRPIGPGVEWTWWVALVVFALGFLSLALLPQPVAAGAKVLTRRPVAALMIGLLAVMLAPFLLMLLALTGIGLFLWPIVVLIGVVFLVAGRAAVCLHLGQWISSGRVTAGPLAYPIGAGVLLLLFLVPFVGGLVWTLVTLQGLGAILLGLRESYRAEHPRSPAPTPSGPLPPPPGSAGGAPGAPLGGASGETAGGAGQVTAAGALPPPPAVYNLGGNTAGQGTELAGFWVRALALLIDFLVIAAGTSLLLEKGPHIFFLTWVIYLTLMLHLRGTTLGGLAMGLEVQRDEGPRQLSWLAAFVRSAAMLISFIPFGLGFWWAVWDARRQTWHDKIAGTVVVRPARVRPLV